MQVKPVPIALFAMGAVTGTGGVALAGKGALDQREAGKRESAAEHLYLARKALTDRRWTATDERLAAYAQLQRESYGDAVLRMVGFLRRHERLVRESERLLVDGIEIAVTSMPTVRTQNVDPGTWIIGARRTVAAGTGTATVISQAADKFGHASTGRPISGLYGAAKDNATRALYGGGSRKSGGGGKALGTPARNTAVVGSALLAAGLVAKGEGVKALANARQYEADMAVERAKLDETDARLRAVNQRAAEVSGVLIELRAYAVSALDELEAVAFDADRHAALFQKAMTLVKGVQDVAATPLITEDGDLTDKSATFTMRYQQMTAKENDG